LRECLDSLLEQSFSAHIIVVDNGSIDGSLDIISDYSNIELIRHSKNLGYAGGVNAGFRRAVKLDMDYVAPFNNDAVADKDWLLNLVRSIEKQADVGIVTSKILSSDGKSIDSTGDYYTIWGLPYPRGRGSTDIDAFDVKTDVFGASGGASLYKITMLQMIGLFDEDFFAYYEDVDLSFRAQLAGWKVRYAPKAVVYHHIGATSEKIKGFTTYQTMKNQPLLLLKNVPRPYLYSVGWRFTIAHILFFVSAIRNGNGWPAIKGDLKGTILLFSGYKKRRDIQRNKKVTDDYIWSILVHDLPPNARSLRKLRSFWWKLTRKHAAK
jgi:GT2 family glycosyltransferase